MSLTYLSEFAGVGGDSEGAHRVPGLIPIFAANHNADAITSHAANHPDVDHWLGDVQCAGGTSTFPYADVAWHSPACPNWTTAKGVERTFDSENQLSLWDPAKSEEEKREEQAAKRSRALMEEVVLYLRTWHRRGRIVKIGVVENVVECRKWADWNRWIGEIKALGYHMRVIALNSMHALAPVGRPCCQSRDRLYVAYWHQSLARTPDWDRWLRPVAWCEVCQEQVRALQIFKKPGADMGKYRAQYVYRCPNVTCRHQVVQPGSLPAASVIDFTDPGTPIGERPRTPAKPRGLSPKTFARVEAGVRKYWAPILTPTGGTWREDATPLHTAPMPARLTRESDGIAVPPPLVPAESREEPARPANSTGRLHHGLAVPDPLLVEYYGTGRAYPAQRPMGTLTTKDRFGVATAPAPANFDIDQVRFRMLSIHEIRAAMAFPDQYLLPIPSKRVNCRLLGNAVTPNAAEVILSALVETVTGQQWPSGWDLFEQSGWAHWDLAA